MEEVKKKTKKAKIEDAQLEEVEPNEAVKAEAKDEDVVKITAKKKAEKETKKKVKAEKKEGEAKEEEKPKSKKAGKVLLILLLVLVILGGGGFAVKSFLTKTSVTTVSAELSSDARGFSNYFKEYLVDRVKAETLFSYSFRNLSNEEILTELTELKDGFSKVSRGLSGNYRNSDYNELADVMESDSALYLTAVRELRTVMTDSYGEEADRQLAFIRKVEETTKDLRSALYLSEVAFTEDVSGLSSKGVLAFAGSAMVEVGGGVMNVMVGDTSNNVTEVSTDDLEKGAVKRIDAKKLYGYSGARVFEIGEGLEATLENGWVKYMKAEVGSSDVKLTTTKISLVMKNVWSLNEELKAQGFAGVVDERSFSMEEELNKVVKGIKGTK